MKYLTIAATLLRLSSPRNTLLWNSSVSGPPFITLPRCCFVNDFMTDTGPSISANRLGEKFVPNGSPRRLPSGDAPISAACQR